jgi:hypothetical protein
VRPLKYLRLEHFQLVASELRLPLLMLSNRLNEVFFDVLQESFDEGGAHLGDTSAQPHIIVEEVSLAREDSQVDSEIVVFTVDDRHQALLYFLGDI